MSDKRLDGRVNIDVQLNGLADNNIDFKKLHSAFREQIADLESSDSDESRKRAQLMTIIQNSFAESEDGGITGKYHDQIRPADVDMNMLSDISKLLPDDVTMNIAISKHDDLEIICEDKSSHRYYNHIDTAFDHGEIMNQSMCHYDRIGDLEAKDPDSHIKINETCFNMSDFKVIAETACSKENVGRNNIDLGFADKGPSVDDKNEISY